MMAAYEQEGKAMFSKKVTALLLIALSSCNSSQQGQESATILIERAQNLPLPGRYSLYKKVFDSDRPPNIVLAKEVVRLGDPALQFAMAEARRGDATDILASIEIVRPMVKEKARKCNRRYLSAIETNIALRFDNSAAGDIVRRRFNFAYGY